MRVIKRFSSQAGDEALARNELNLFSDRSPRWPRTVFFTTLFAVLVAGAWVFAPPLMAKFIPNLTAKIETSLPKLNVARQTPMKTEPAQQSPATVVELQSITMATPQPADSPEPAAPVSTPAFAPVPPPEVTASSPNWPLAAAGNRPVQMETAMPDDIGALDHVPLPRRRPDLAIASRTGIPLPRPRPDIGNDGPTPEEIASELQVDRMR